MDTYRVEFADGHAELQAGSSNLDAALAAARRYNKGKSVEDRVKVLKSILHKEAA